MMLLLIVVVVLDGNIKAIKVMEVSSDGEYLMEVVVVDYQKRNQLVVMKNFLGS